MVFRRNLIRLAIASDPKRAQFQSHLATISGAKNPADWRDFLYLGFDENVVIRSSVAVPGAGPRHVLGLGQHNAKTMQSDQKRRGFSASEFGQRLLARRS